MPLSIRNTSHISQQDIITIANCDLNTHHIVYKVNASHGSKIATLSKKEVTCWQLFLRILGMGNLVNYNIGLATVTTNLNQFNWREGTSMARNSIYYHAYLNVCVLANKALYSRHDETLVNNVASTMVAKDVEFVQYQGNREIHRHNMQQRFNLNPCMEFKHIQTLLVKRFPNMHIRITQSHHQPYPGNAHATPTQLYHARILVEQHLSHVQPVPPPSRPNRRIQNQRF